MAQPQAIWYPTHVALRKAASAVCWTDLSGQPFAEPFFHQTAARADACASVITALEEEPPGLAVPGMAPAAFIFHVSRCGSTLLCNVLRALHDTQVVGEPQPVTALLAPLEAGVWPYAPVEWQARRDLLLRRMVERLGQPSLPGASRYVIKFTSYSAMRMGVLRALWPQVPVIFLVRDPVEVLVSNLRRSPGWMHLWQRPRQAASVFGWRESSTDMPREEFLARAYGSLCQTASRHIEAPSLVLDYRELLADGGQRVMAELGLGRPDAAEQTRIDAALGRYSKDVAGQAPHQADGAAKLAQATPAVHAAAERWARPGLRALLAATG